MRDDHDQLKKKSCLIVNMMPSSSSAPTSEYGFRNLLKPSNKEDKDTFRTELPRQLPLMEDFDRILPGISAKLKENKALIAGGSIVSMMMNEVVNDVDIYVHPNGGVNLLNYLVESSKEIVYGGGAFTYGKAGFMTQNHILIRYCLKVRDVDVDVMFVDPFVEISDIIRHFDLSCSMFSFNGEKVQAEHELANDIIRERPAKFYLMPWYKEYLIKGNWTTLRRIRKYQRRLDTTIQLELPDHVAPDPPLKKMYVPRFVTKFLKLVPYKYATVFVDALDNLKRKKRAPMNLDLNTMFSGSLQLDLFMEMREEMKTRQQKHPPLLLSLTNVDYLDYFFEDVPLAISVGQRLRFCYSIILGNYYNRDELIVNYGSLLQTQKKKFEYMLPYMPFYKQEMLKFNLEVIKIVERMERGEIDEWKLMLQLLTDAEKKKSSNNEYLYNPATLILVPHAKSSCVRCVVPENRLNRGGSSSRFSFALFPFLVTPTARTEGEFADRSYYKPRNTMRHTCEDQITLYHYDLEGVGDFAQGAYTFTHDVLYTHSNPDWYWMSEEEEQGRSVKVIVKWPAFFPMNRYCHYMDEDQQTARKDSVFILPPACWVVEDIYIFAPKETYVQKEVFIRPLFVFLDSQPGFSDAVFKYSRIDRRSMGVFFKEYGPGVKTMDALSSVATPMSVDLSQMGSRLRKAYPSCQKLNYYSTENDDCWGRFLGEEELASLKEKIAIHCLRRVQNPATRAVLCGIGRAMHKPQSFNSTKLFPNRKKQVSIAELTWRETTTSQQWNTRKELTSIESCPMFRGEGAFNTTWVIEDASLGRDSTPLLLRVSKRLYKDEKKLFDQEIHRGRKLAEAGAAPRMLDFFESPTNDIRDIFKITNDASQCGDMPPLAGHLVVVLEYYKYSLWGYVRSKFTPGFGMLWSPSKELIDSVTSCIQTIANHGTCCFDIKPENIVMNSELDLRFIDFGSDFCKDYSPEENDLCEISRFIMILLFYTHMVRQVRKVDFSTEILDFMKEMTRRIWTESLLPKSWYKLANDVTDIYFDSSFFNSLDQFKADFALE